MSTDTDFNLDAIKARCEAATPGPWEHQPEAGWIEIVGPSADGDENIIASAIRPYGGWGEASYSTTAEPDAEFVANSRTDIPVMVAVIERQAAEIARLEAGRETERIALGNALKLISVMQEQYEKEVAIISDVSETGEQ